MKNVRYQFVGLCLGLLVFALAPFSVNAAKLPDMYRAGVTTTGNSAKVGVVQSTNPAWGSTIPISPNLGGWSQAGNYGLPSSAKGTTMNMNANGDVFIAGTKYPFQAAYAVPASNVWDGAAKLATILGGVSGGPFGLALMVAGGAAPYIKTWMDDANVRVDPATGNTIQKASAESCTVAPCYEYKNTYPATWSKSPAAACSAYVAEMQIRNPTYGIVFVSIVGTTCTYQNTTAPPYTPVSQAQAVRSRTPDTSVTWDAVTSLDSLAPVMTAKPFHPGAAQEVWDKGGEITIPAPTITGPATQPGTTTTKNNSDGTVTTTTIVNNYTISGDTITNNSQVSTVVNKTGDVVNSTTTETKAPAPADKPADPLTDCDKIPDAAGCAKLGTPPVADVIPHSTQAVSVVAAAFASNETCPSPLAFDVRGQSYAVSWSPLCDAAAALKMLVLAVAGILAAYVLANGFKV